MITASGKLDGVRQSNGFEYGRQLLPSGERELIRLLEEIKRSRNFTPLVTMFANPYREQLINETVHLMIELLK